MIAKYPGTCCYCKRPTAAGVDQYEVETRKSYHPDCLPGSLPFDHDAAERIAERLGFLDHEAAMKGDWFK
jgi:hypothetical protein